MFSSVLLCPIMCSGMSHLVYLCRFASGDLEMALAELDTMYADQARVAAALSAASSANGGNDNIIASSASTSQTSAKDAIDPSALTVDSGSEAALSSASDLSSSSASEPLSELDAIASMPIDAGADDQAAFLAHLQQLSTTPSSSSSSSSPSVPSDASAAASADTDSASAAAASKSATASANGDVNGDVNGKVDEAEFAALSELPVVSLGRNGTRVDEDEDAIDDDGVDGFDNDAKDAAMNGTSESEASASSHNADTQTPAPAAASKPNHTKGKFGADKDKAAKTTKEQEQDEDELSRRLKAAEAKGTHAKGALSRLRALESDQVCDFNVLFFCAERIIPGCDDD
jgi:hypothetical protein